MALDAGNDVLMITYPEKAVLMKNTIARWMREDSQLMEQINDSVRRILAAKIKAGLIHNNPPS
jgi:beta-N-acetylhexosaminidase